MQQLMSRVDGKPSMVTPASIIGPTAPEGAATSKAPTSRGVRSRRRRSTCRADWMSGRVPTEIERLALTEATEIGCELAAAGLM